MNTLSEQPRLIKVDWIEKVPKEVDSDHSRDVEDACLTRNTFKSNIDTKCLVYLEKSGFNLWKSNTSVSQWSVMWILLARLYSLTVDSLIYSEVLVRNCKCNFNAKTLEQVSLP